MAKEEDIQQDLQEEEAQPAQPAEQKTSSGELLQGLIPAVAVMVLAIAGFITGKLLSSGPAASQAQTAEKAPQPEQQKQEIDLLAEETPGAKPWYYDLEPVATNLSEPRATRYVRAAITLEMSPKINKQKGTQFLDERKPIMTNLLNIYFAGLTIEDLNSDEDIRRIQSELVDVFNENLFPEGKPLIQKILFREFGVQ